MPVVLMTTKRDENYSKGLTKASINTQPVLINNV